jgi:hypothetical protein
MLHCLALKAVDVLMADLTLAVMCAMQTDAEAQILGNRRCLRSHIPELASWQAHPLYTRTHLLCLRPSLPHLTPPTPHRRGCRTQLSWGAPARPLPMACRHHMTVHRTPQRPSCPRPFTTWKGVSASTGNNLCLIHNDHRLTCCAPAPWLCNSLAMHAPHSQRRSPKRSLFLEKFAHR